jgi:hypothetical protein
MGPKFENPILDGNDLEVRGPFDTHGDVLDDVVVRFLIIKDGSNTPIFGTAKIPNNELKKCECPDCEDQALGAKITSGTFSKTVRNQGLRVGDRVRAIGLSVAVKKADGHDPPAFETFTWCVTVEVVGP